MILDKRDQCIDRFTGRVVECNGVWDSWARWLFLGLIIFGFLLLFFLFSCISARRRRRGGLAPLRGTGWANRNQQPQQNPQNTYYAYQQPAPPYEPNPAYTQSNHNNNQSTGIELERPQGTYNGQYAPPPGPPPAKK